jgi:hypothetical protein
MTEHYANLYREVLDRRRPISAPVQAHGVPLERRIWKLTALIPGGFPSAHVRILRRYHHPEVQWKLRTRVRVGLDSLSLDDTDCVLVQRHAVSSEQAAAFAQELRGHGLPLVLDLDDHLLAAEYGDAEHFAAQAESIRVLLDAASLVTVSTPALARTIGDLCRRVLVVRNQLDERLFLAGTGGEPPAPTASNGGDPIRLVYAGSLSHADDLAFLREVLERLRSRSGRFELDVVGGEHPDGEPQWYRRREVPTDGGAYPEYVALLRRLRPEWDIAVAPLLDTPFNRHKSDLKFLEYSGLGLPGVYSAVEPYASVRDGETGLRARNSVEEWCEQIERLASDGDLRDRLRAAAWREVTGGRLLRHDAARLLETIGNVLAAGPIGLELSNGTVNVPAAETVASLTTDLEGSHRH